MTHSASSASPRRVLFICQYNQEKHHEVYLK
nr:MAG TPA_asm: Protein tyrosine phosphatase [Caudoviricetes sp.]